jgi:hypothetical protein
VEIIVNNMDQCIKAGKQASKEQKRTTTRNKREPQQGTKENHNKEQKRTNKGLPVSAGRSAPRFI